MTMTVKELTKWLSELYDQDAQVEVLEERQDIDGTWFITEVPVDVNSNVRYSVIKPRSSGQHGTPILSFLTFGNTG